MADNIYKQNVYSYKQHMWHKKGIVGQTQETFEQVYGRMKPVEFGKFPATFNVNGRVVPTKVNGIFRIEGDKLFIETLPAPSVTAPELGVVRGILEFERTK